MDVFVRTGNHRVGPGGLRCACCQEFTSRKTSNRRRVNRYARRALRHADHSIYVLGARAHR